MCTTRTLVAHPSLLIFPFIILRAESLCDWRDVECSCAAKLNVLGLVTEFTFTVSALYLIYLSTYHLTCPHGFLPPPFLPQLPWYSERIIHFTTFGYLTFSSFVTCLIFALLAVAQLRPNDTRAGTLDRSVSPPPTAGLYTIL